jgi:hypothetical protein
MFKIVDPVSGAGIGSVGFWTKDWREEQVYEVGWMGVPEFQGRGLAVAATTPAIELAKQARLRAVRGVRVRISQAAPHALQRLAPGPARLRLSARPPARSGRVAHERIRAPRPAESAIALATFRIRRVGGLSVAPGSGEQPRGVG